MTIIRLASCEDVPAILDIYNDAVLHTTASYDYQPKTLAERVAWFEQHQQQQYPVFVAVAPEAGVVGWSSLSQFNAKPGYRFTAENSVYVASAHRRQGLGKQLLAPLITAGRERGLRAILALIDADNTPSVRLHAAFGFQEAARLKQVGFKFDRWLDVVIMELLLATP